MLPLGSFVVSFLFFSLSIVGGTFVIGSDKQFGENGWRTVAAKLRGFLYRISKLKIALALRHAHI